MLTKFIIIAFTAEILFSQNTVLANCVNSTCPKWVKLNKSPVCFGGKGDSFGKFTYDKNIFVSSFMFVHRTGTVTCNKSQYSYWGCAPNHKNLAVILTVLADNQEKILAPAASKVDARTGWYNLESYHSSSSILVFCVPKKPHCIFANSELRLWYGEDLKGSTESDNGGRTCADVYGLLA